MIAFAGWLRFVRVWLFVIPALMLLSLGCRGREPVDRLRLLAVESPVISPQTPLDVRAEGLPTARTLRVRLRGLLSAVGQDGRRLDVSLVGHVLSPERLSIAVDAGRIGRWGRATFEGELVVECDPPKPRRCAGSLSPVRFDVEWLGERRAQQLRYAVDRLLPRLGLRISDADPAEHGLLVAEVVAGGLAARAGLRAGDTILRSNGVSLHGFADLAPGPNADVLALWVRRSGQTRALRVALVEGPPLSDWRMLGLCVALCPLLVWGLGRFGLPAPGRLWRAARARWCGLRARWGWLFGLGAVLSGALGAYSAWWAFGFDPLVLLLVHLSGVLALRGFRAEGVQRLVADVLGLWLGVLCVAAVSGTRGWLPLLRDQGAAPWAWNALARLPLSFAFVLCVLSAARMHAACAQVARGFGARLWERALRAIVATLCAGLFLGGAYLAPSAGVVSVALAGALAAAKSVVCYGLLEVVERDAARSRTALWWCLIGATLLWMQLAPSRSFEWMWGSAACVLAAFLVLAGVVAGRHEGRQARQSSARTRRSAGASGVPQGAAGLGAPRASEARRAATRTAAAPLR